MRKIVLIIYLTFAILTLIGEICFDFRETRISYYSLSFKEHFEVKKFYITDTETNIASDGPAGEVLKGYIQNETKDRYLTVSDDIASEFSLFDSNKNIYYEVWYCKSLDIIKMKVSQNGFIYYNGFLIDIMLFFIIPSIIKLIKILKNEKNNSN